MKYSIKNRRGTVEVPEEFNFHCYGDLRSFYIDAIIGDRAAIRIYSAALERSWYHYWTLDTVLKYFKFGQPIPVRRHRLLTLGHSPATWIFEDYPSVEGHLVKVQYDGPQPQESKGIISSESHFSASEYVFLCNNELYGMRLRFNYSDPGLAAAAERHVYDVRTFTLQGVVCSIDVAGVEKQFYLYKAKIIGDWFEEDLMFINAIRISQRIESGIYYALIGKELRLVYLSDPEQKGPLNGSDYWKNDVYV